MKKALIISYVFIAVLLTGLTLAFVNIYQQNYKIVQLEKQLSQNNVQSSQVSLSQKDIDANDVAYSYRRVRYGRNTVGEALQELFSRTDDLDTRLYNVESR